MKKVKDQYNTLRNKINREPKIAKEMWIEKNCEEIDNIIMKCNTLAYTSRLLQMLR